MVLVRGLGGESVAVASSERAAARLSFLTLVRDEAFAGVGAGR